MPNGIIDPFDKQKSDIVDPFGQPKFLAPSVPVPETGTIVPTSIIDPFEARPSPLTGLQELLLPKVMPVVEPQLIPPRPVTPVISPRVPQVLPSRGILTDIPAAIAQGIVDVGQMAGEIGQTLGIPGAERLARGAERLPETIPFLTPSREAAEGLVRGAVTGGFRSVVPSAAFSFPLGTLGYKLSKLASLGRAAGPFGFAVGAAAGGIPFGMAEYSRFLNEAKDAGLDPESVKGKAFLSALVEGGVEGLANLVAARILLGGMAEGPIRAFKDALKRPFMTSVKAYLKALPVEVGTEMTQEAAEAKFRRDAGIPAETPWESAKHVIGPTVVMTGIFAIGAGSWNRRIRKQVQGALENGNVDPQQREWAANVIAGNLEEQKQPELAAFWLNAVRPKIDNKEGVDLDKPISDWLDKVETTPEVGAVVPPEAVPVPAPIQAQPEPGVTPPPVTPPPVPTPELAPPPAPPGPVFPPQPPVIPPPVVEKPPEVPKPPIKAPAPAPTPVPTPIPEPIPWEGPEWTEPGREVTFTNPNTDKQMRGVIRDVVLGPPDGKTPVTITVSPKWRMDQTFDLPAAEVTEPAAILRMKEYHAALEGLHPADRAQVRKNAKEFDRLLLANADLFVDKGEIDFFYEGATTPRKQAIASNQILNNARSEAGKELAIDDVYNPISRAEALAKLRDRIERERPGTTVPIPVTPKPTPPPQPTTFKPTAPPKAETARGPVAAPPVAPVAAPIPEVLYRGGPKEQKFTPETLYLSTRGDSSQLGFFFSPTELGAKHYAGMEGEVKSFRLNAKKTYTLNQDEYQKQGSKKDFRDLRQRLLNEGYDTVVIPHMDEFVALTPGVIEEVALPPAPEKPVEPTPPIPTAPVPEAPAKPEHGLAQRISTEIKDRMTGLIDSPITNTSLFNLAAIEFGGTRAEGKFTPRQAYDAMELGVNKYLQENPDQTTPEGLKKLESIIPTQSIRTEEMQLLQQFSTPPKIAHATNWLANINETDIFTETSAGNGSLSIFADIAGAKAMILNELDTGRVENLKFLFPKAEVFNENAEHASDIIGPKLTEKPTVAVINPPFSTSGERMPGKKILDVVEKHIDQTLKLLQPNGRLVVITGRGFTLEAPTFREFWDRLRSQYTIQANLGLDGKNYKKYGTQFDIRITVIDKTGPTIGEVYTRDYATTDEMLNDPKLQEIRDGRKEIERRVTGELAPTQPPVEAGYQEPGREPGAERPVLAPVGPTLLGPERIPPAIPGLPAGVERIEPAPAEAVTGLPGVVPGRPGEVSVRPPGEELGPGRPGVERVGPAGIERIGPERGLPEAGGGPTLVDTLQIPTVTVPEKTELKDNKLYEDARYPKQDMGGAHPTKLVEPVALVDIDPPSIDNITLNLKPENLKGNEKGKISSDQIYITKLVKRAHSKGMAFFNAGGTGSGKGLANAAAIMDLWNSGKKKAVWMSQSKELRKDALRDWKMLGGRDEDIVELSKIKNNQTVAEYLKAKQMPNQGILFFSYNLLAMPEGKKEGAKKRIDQVLEWLGPDFDGAVIFDESHNMANAIPTQGRFGKKKPAQKALTGLDFQGQIPNARVIYSSATGATELENLAYAKGLKVWGEGTSFADVYDFLNKVAPHGTAGLEMVAADLKRKGVYLAPSISFEGVTQEKLSHALTADQTEMYDEVARMWQKVLHNIHAVMEATGANLNPGARRNAAGIFWGAQQRFFQQMILAMQMPTVVAHAKAEITKGNSPVIQLVNTNEASQERAFARKSEEQELEELDLTPKDILMTYLEQSFPIGKYEEYLDENGNVQSRPVMDSQGNMVIDPEAKAVRDNLLADLGGMKFPENPLDYLIHEIGHDKIAEVTGRGRRLVYKEGKLSEEQRSDLIIQGEVQDFYDDKKIGLVFSQKGNTGFSYDSDKSFINQRKRIHYLVQAGWRADQVFQGLGRSHRANEAVPPHIARASIDVPAAQRFDASIARRLEQLGAISKGQRQTTSQGLFSARENLENTQAKDALQRFYRDLYNGSIEGLTTAEFADQTGLKLLDKNGNLIEQLPPIQQFLNRMLSMELEGQRTVFTHFSHLLDIEIEQAERSGRLDLGLRNLHALKIDVLSDKTVYTDTETGSKTNLMHIQSTHESPIFTHKQMTGWAEGVVRNIRSEKIWAAGKVFNRTNPDGSVERVVPLRSANYTTEYVKESDLKDIKKWTPIAREKVKEEWDKAVETAPKTTTKDHYMITGMKLPIWDRMGSNGNVWRFIVDGKAIVGKEVHQSELEKVLKGLNAEADAIKMDVAEVFETIIDQNKIIKLANDWKFRRTRSQGEERIEVIGPDKAFHNSFREMGIAIELIDYRTRYFIPTEPEKAKTILEKLLKNRPIVEVGERSRNQTFFKLDHVVPDPTGGGVSQEIFQDIIHKALSLLPSASKIELVDKIDVSKFSPELFLKASERWTGGDMNYTCSLAGVTQISKIKGSQYAALIEVATSIKSGRKIEKTIWHETWEGISSFYLSEKQKAILREAYPTEPTKIGMKDTGEVQADAFADYVVDLRKPKTSVEKIFAYLKDILERIGNYLHGLGFQSAHSIFGEAYSGALQRQYAQLVGDSRYFFSLDDAPLPTPMQDNLDALTDPQILHRFASDPTAMAWLKQRMGILNIPNTDLKRWEQYFSLPYWLGKKYPVYNKALHRQTSREKLRSEGVQQFLAAAQPFMMLKGEQLSKVEKALIDGDREKRVYDEGILRERFGLTPTGIEAYVSVRSTLDIMLHRWADHAEWALLRPFEKTFTAEEYQQLVNIHKTVLTPNEIAALSPKLGRAYQRIQPGVNLIKRIRGRVAELKGYFPRYREPGKYYVAVKQTVEDAEGNKQEITTFTTFANSEWEVTKIVKGLEAEKEPNEKIIYGVHTQEHESSFFGVSDQNLQRLIDNAIQTIKQEGNINQEQANELRLGLSQALAETLMRRGAGARMLKRAGRVIEGYETTGLPQVLKNYIVGYMGMETKQDAAYDFLEILSEVPEKQSRLFQEVSHYVDTMLRNYDREDQWFSKCRALAFIYYLGGTLRAPIVNFTQNFVTGIPFLASEMKGMGWLGAERVYTKAMWDVASGNLTEEERFMEHELLMKGVSNDQWVRQISREIRGTMGELTGKVFDILAWPFSKMEIWNRQSAGLAVFRVYRQKGLSFEESINKAEEFIYDTHYLMTKANLPHVARGGDIPSKLIGTAYTFRRFNHNYILSMLYSMCRGPDGRFHWKNMDVFIRSLVWMSIFGGLAGLPFLDDLLDELERFFGRPFRTQMRQELRAMGGEPLERAGMAGIPALLGQIPGMVGVDLSGSLRLGLPSFTQPARGAQETVFGVWGGLAKKMTNAWESVGREDYLRAVEFASPAFIENVFKAARMSTMGATTPRGQVLFDEKGRPIKETPGEATAQMLGFRPERIAAMAGTYREFANVESSFREKRDNIYARFRLAKTGEERTRVIRDVQKYNLAAQKYRGAIPMINADSLRKSFAAKPEKRYMAFGAMAS